MQTTATEPALATAEQRKLARTFDFNLEALRGVAAMLVVWHHFIYHQNRLDPAYTPTGIFSFNPPGHLSVLVFFVLSGYVIGRVHIEPLMGDDILPYLKKRFIRIYPIYFLTIIIAYLVANQWYSLEVLIGDLTIVQRVDGIIIFENNPAWSLAFEIFFYLLFIPISFLRHVGNIAFFAAGIGIIAISQESYVGGAYALGFSFWLCGISGPTIPAHRKIIIRLDGEHITIAADFGKIQFLYHCAGQGHVSFTKQARDIQFRAGANSRFSPVALLRAFSTGIC